MLFERRLGLHFDFHARPYDGMPSIGESLREEDIREICQTLKPDCIQIDCKGHPGWASYPTKLGNTMPDIRFDTLRLWRRITKEEGVKLFMHYSGVMDERFCRVHPELAVMHEDGRRDTSVTRTYGFRYADMLLIPQLKELAGEYGVDGVWVDGECWATSMDYDPETVKAFEEESGVKISDSLPLEPNSSEYIAFKQYCRELFRKYVRYYTDEIHKSYPSFMITSNWMFSDHMPEPLSAELDFISGDFNPWNSVFSARLAGRSLARQGKNWDMMSWNFRVDRTGYSAGRYVKHPVQIMQEAACVTSLGGGFQNYITQNRDGSPRMEQIRRMKSVFENVRERLPWCYGGRIVPQIAVFLSANDRIFASKKLFGRDGLDGTAGLTSLFCDLGHGVSVASDFDYNKGYKVIAVPETLFSLGEAPRKLLEYAYEGGSLLITGIKSIEEFIASGLPVNILDKYPDLRSYTLDKESYTSVYDSCTFSAQDAATVAVSCQEVRDEHLPYACVLQYGKGLIALVGSDIGLSYHEAKQYGHKNLMNDLLGRLYNPLVSLVSAEGTVEITPLYKDGRLLIQLVNMNGPHSDTRTPSFDYIQPCREVKLSVAFQEKPEKLIQRPSGNSLLFNWDGERASFTIDRVDIHEIVEIQAAVKK